MVDREGSETLRELVRGGRKAVIKEGAKQEKEIARMSSR